MNKSKTKKVKSKTEIFRCFVCEHYFKMDKLSKCQENYVCKKCFNAENKMWRDFLTGLGIKYVGDKRSS